MSTCTEIFIIKFSLKVIMITVILDDIKLKLTGEDDMGIPKQLAMSHKDLPFSFWNIEKREM